MRTLSNSCRAYLSTPCLRGSRKQSCLLKHQQLSRKQPGSQRLVAPAAAKESATDSLQEESSRQLTKALDNLEDGLDADVAKALDGLVGVHKFDDQQQEVFQYLVAQMRHCAMGLFALAGVVTLILVKQIWEGKSIPLPGISLAGVAVSQISHSLNAVVVAALMWAGAVSFKKVVSQDQNQLAYAFQGIIQLSIIFMQIAPITVCFAVVNIVEAAVRWPEVASFVAAAVAATTLIRASSLGVLLARYSPGTKGAAKVILALRNGWRGLRYFPLFPDRVALVVSAGVLLPYSTPDFATTLTKADKREEVLKGDIPSDDEELEDALQGEPKPDRKETHEEGEEEGEGPEEYEFTRWEERVLQVVMDAMRMSALALSLQALSSIMLGTAVLLKSGPWAAHSYFMNDLVDQSVRAALLFASAGCFQRVAESSGHDITHLLEGLGRERGLGLLFHRMQKLAWGMAMFKTLFDLVLPVIMSTHTWQKFQAAVVRFVANNVPKGSQLTAALGL